jgi:hypothetical protein
MPWEYILGGAGGAGIIIVLAIILAPKIIERIVQNQLDVRLQKLRGFQSRNLEFDKSELEVWAQIRKDILTQMWEAHREIVGAMTLVILKTQELERTSDLGKLSPDIDRYRQTIHKSIDLISPDGIEICQDFLMTAYDICHAKRSPEDANPLKATRREFYEYTSEFYGLERIMPWMAKTSEDPSDA